MTELSTLMTDLATLAGVTAEDLDQRTGYDPAFLGIDVPMPSLSGGEPTLALTYTHYTVLFRPDRRLAAVTALAMDGAHLVSLDRDGIPWQFDPRLAPDLQAGAPVYSHNDFDRGHLVMRASACWGNTEAEAAQGNRETFFYTNAAPQAAMFNQGKELWLGLEQYVMNHAETFDRRLAVLAGPVLQPGDPPYRGIRVPLRFWKVVAFLQDGALAATGYLLDQTPLVHDHEAAFAAAAAAGQPPPLGAYRTFQLPIADIARLAQVRLDQLAAVDLMKATPSVTVPGPGRTGDSWVQLRTLDDISL